ncbi:hypothetical protein [Gandjariella thermophila]|uniref:Uncharacterized protein n=1 Tax=Gandjariella thermophila TaxID=1931992 RepID=A0A4D4J543_9PSEU|nr:hypothetical protein [Gandjariella thermophila]GDY29083.1 hypothetical protein GTS_07160 [Gandjariella thermophila]
MTLPWSDRDDAPGTDVMLSDLQFQDRGCANGEVRPGSSPTMADCRSAQELGQPRPMGNLSSPLTFGHNGSNCCLAWTDPTRRLVFVYLTDLLTDGHEGAHHQGAVSDAVLAACPPDANLGAQSATRRDAPIEGIGHLL